MNRRRDIERVLDAWLVDGVSQMPDRLFDTVLDRVERTPQRHRPWSNLRFPPMTPRLYLTTAAAIVVAAGAVGFAVLGGPSPVTPPGATASPTAPPATPSPSPTLLDLGPREIRDYAWLGEPRPADELGADVELMALVFKEDKLRLDTGLTWLMQSEMRAAGPREFTLTSVENPGGCAVGDVGRYQWSLSPGGTKLVLDHIQDECSSRAAVLPGEWQRAGCEETWCLGELEASRYASQFFDPFAAATDPSKPRFGALRYAVPDGWSNIEDEHATYRLARSESAAEPRIDLHAEVLVASQSDPCKEEPDPDVGRTAAAITDWLGSAPGVVSSVPVAVSIGDLDGWLIDVGMEPGGTPPCSSGTGVPYGVLFTDGEPSEGFSWSVRPEMRMRLYVLDLGDGRTLLIEIRSPDATTHGAVLAEATGIVESFEFE